MDVIFGGGNSVRVKTYKSTDVQMQDANGNPLAFNLAQQFVCRLSKVGPLSFFELECQVQVGVGGTNFLQLLVPPEFNAKDPNAVAIINTTNVSVTNQLSQLVNVNVVNPTPINGNNPVILFIQGVNTGQTYPAGPCNIFGISFWTAG